MTIGKGTTSVVPSPSKSDPRFSACLGGRLKGGIVVCWRQLSSWAAAFAAKDLCNYRNSIHHIGAHRHPHANRIDSS
jgi:hypothetical protein